MAAVCKTKTNLHFPSKLCILIIVIVIVIIIIIIIVIVIVIVIIIIIIIITITIIIIIIIIILILLLLLLIIIIIIIIISLIPNTLEFAYIDLTHHEQQQNPVPTCFIRDDLLCGFPFEQLLLSCLVRIGKASCKCSKTRSPKNVDSRWVPNFLISILKSVKIIIQNHSNAILYHTHRTKYGIFTYMSPIN